MIPKIIHYSWFSDDPIPEDIQHIMESWRRVLPDYEFRLWDGDTLRALDLPFAHEAVSVGKWAFAADQLRIYAVYTYGGIWLDTDVEMCKSFDPYLEHRFFIGHENWTNYHFGLSQQLLVTLTSHCFGAEAGHPFLKRCLEYYEGRHFITSTDETLPENMRLDLRLLPDIQSVLAKSFGYEGHPFSIYRTEVLSEDMHIYPAHYFDAPKYKPMDEVVCIHHCKGAWFGNQAVHSRKLKKNVWYYLYGLLSSFLKRRGIYFKMYYVGHPQKQ